MPTNKAIQVTISTKQKKILEGFSKGTHTQQHLKTRSTIILMSACGNSNSYISRELNMDYGTASLWRSRFADAFEILEKTEKESPLHLKKEIIKVLSDCPRPGAPSVFTKEQRAAIIALSCEDPEKLNLPFSHWTPALLREEAIKKGIVSSISVRQIGRFLKRS